MPTFAHHDGAIWRVSCTPSGRQVFDTGACNGYLGSSKDEFTAKFLFYNYATDETIEVSFMPDGSAVIKASVAASYQPPEHPIEVENAVTLANSVLLGQGFDTSGLAGHALLDYQK